MEQGAVRELRGSPRPDERSVRTPRARRPRAFVGPYALFWFYVRWLRRHLVQELLAGAGVAIAVALVFATIVAAGSVSGSSTQAVRTVVGPASLQLHARSGQGISGSLLAAAQRLPGVRAAGSLLEASATLRAANGRTATVDLAGAGTSLVFMDGLVHRIPSATLSAQGIGLSSRTAGELAISGGGPATTPQGSVEVYARGRRTSVPISAVLGQEAFGALSHTSVAVMQLTELQKLIGLPDHLSRILVEPNPGERAKVRAELTRLAGGRIDVAAADQDIGLLSQALRPSDQASALFATVSALLGVLLATAALLLTAPERRAMIADLRLMGMRRSAIVQMFAFQALMLGAAASVLGIACGYGLSVSLLAQSPRYLAEAFTLGTQTTLSYASLIAALGTGIVSCGIASTLPLLDLRGNDPLRNVYQQQGLPGNGLHPATRRVLGAGALVLLLAATALLATAPSLALLACVLLALASVCAVPLALSAVAWACTLLARWRQKLTTLPVALSSMQATSLRSFALAATGALALFGGIALGGARGDLAHGIAGFAHSYAADAALWVGNRGDDQAVLSFAAGDLRRRISAVPGVAGVAEDGGGFVVIDGRRVWMIARPPGAARHVLASQTVEGSPALAQRRLAQGGWVVVSQQIAEEQHVGIGSRIALPTPSGDASLRIAAFSNNLAWSPGAIFIGSAQYERLWPGAGVTALGVTLAPGASMQVLARRIRQLVGSSSSGSGLIVRTRSALQASIDTLTSEGLGQLQEISNLLLAAAILAMAAALTSAVWQRRPALAALRLCGIPPARLRAILLVEAGLLLSAGCVTGALMGIYGQAIIDGYLGRVTGFPVAAIAADARPLEIFALVVVVVFAAACTPIVLASRVPPSLALAE
jgi:putative ABC transport system permease protein